MKYEWQKKRKKILTRLPCRIVPTVNEFKTVKSSPFKYKIIVKAESRYEFREGDILYLRYLE